MRTTSKKSANLLFSGVFALTVGNVLVKLLGLFLKVELQAILGDAGMSYYTVANELYVWLYTVSTAGLPVALSILTSDARAKGNLREANKIFKISMRIFMLVGFAGMVIMFAGSKLFAHMYKFDDANYAIMAIAPTLFFICISSVYRGYFQGYQRMTPTAVSEVIETLGKVTIGIALAKYAASKGYELWVIAAYSLVGLSIGVGLGMVYLFITKLCFREAAYNTEYQVAGAGRMRVHSTKTIVRMILAVAIPITISSSVMSFTNVIDGMILSNRLMSIGYTKEVVKTVFGNYKTLAISLFNLPPVLIYPISSSIVPFLRAAKTSGDKKRIRRTFDSSLRLTSLIALPCAVGMSVLSEPILKLIFSRSAASAEMAAPLLSILAPAIFPLGIFSVTTAILQSHKLEKLPIVSIIAGSVVKLITSFVLIGIKSVGIYGAPIGTLLCYITTILFNFWFLRTRVGYTPRIMRVFMRPMISAAFCGTAAALCHIGFSRLLPTRTAIVTLLSILVAAGVYVICIFRLHAVTRGDILMMPKGQSIYRLLLKIRLMKEVPAYGNQMGSGQGRLPR